MNQNIKDMLSYILNHRYFPNIAQCYNIFNLTIFKSLLNIYVYLISKPYTSYIPIILLYYSNKR